MISGRDDHGLLERAVIGLQRGPSDPAIAATARDGEFARVKGRQGPWTHVVLVASGEEGWIKDRYLKCSPGLPHKTLAHSSLSANV